MPEESVEVTVARMGERFESLQGDLRRLAESYEKLVESNERISLLERDVADYKEQLSALWKRYEKVTDELTSHKLAGGNGAKKMWYEVAKIGLSVFAGALAAAFGVRLS